MATDGIARKVIVGIAAGRIAIGGGALLVTRPALRGLGFPDPDASGYSLARLAGGRDIALGVLTLAARDNATALRAMALTTAAVDVVDALVLGLAGRRHGELRLAGIGGVASAGSAALASVWAWRRLGDQLGDRRGQAGAAVQGV